MPLTARTKTGLVVAAVALALLALIFYASMGLTQVTCEVCIEFNNQTKCRTAQGPTKEDAQRTGTDNACSFLASGMDQSIRCAATPPKSVNCR